MAANRKQEIRVRKEASGRGVLLRNVWFDLLSRVQTYHGQISSKNDSLGKLGLMARLPDSRASSTELALVVYAPRCVFSRSQTTFVRAIYDKNDCLS